MNTLELKLNFHKLIDNITNENMLTAFYEIMTNAKDQSDGSLWAKLTVEERQELIETEKDSHNIDNLIPHSEMKAKYNKWL
jgi:predicted nucleotidyltransferase